MFSSIIYGDEESLRIDMKILYYLGTAIIGALCGWLYYKFVGCRGGG
ncbi:hypothetical protein ACFLYJ_03370 [Candidatus Cloacimonadota bacterium]